jgi:kynurenine formamidase
MSVKIIDLSHPLSSDMPVYPGDPSPAIEPLTLIEKAGYRSTRLYMHSHLGTHVDAPSHILKNGLTLEGYPLDTFTGTGVCVDCRSMSSIPAKFLQEILPAGTFDFLLICTGWSKHWNFAEYFSDFPYLQQDASNFLCRRGIKAVGIDAPGFDPVDGELINHQILLGDNILLIENLCNLEALLHNPFRFYGFPLNFSKADGSPVRACAEITPS